MPATHSFLPPHLPVFFLVLGIILVAIVVIKSASTTKKTSLEFTRRALMNPTEQKLFNKLRSATQHHVFPQVSMQAFLHTKNNATRNRISQKYTDYVICDQNMNTLAIIEYDGPSHNGKRQKERDEVKNKAAKSAGIEVIRWSKMPSDESIRAELSRFN